MAESPNPDEVLNVEGPEGETLFRRFLVWCLPREWEPTIQAEVDEVFARLNSADDRAVALVGALLVENAVNELVSAYVPGYNALAENRDFTLSLRIELARALKLCPARLLGAADTVRAIRNDFAHELGTTGFDQCASKYIESARGHLRIVQRKLSEGKTGREVFMSLVSMICLALRGYKFHVERLNRYIRETDAFRTELQAYCTRHYPQFRP
jgi:hypothetical protein